MVRGEIKNLHAIKLATGIISNKGIINTMI